MSAGKQAAAFVAIVAVVVGGAAVAPFATGADAAPDYAPVENENFRPDDIVVDESPENGRVTMDSSTSGKTVLVDAGHGNDFTRSDLSPLVSALTRNGHTVRFYNGRRASLNESLRGADAFVVVNPREPFAPGEVDGVTAFADAGGRVLLLGDPPSTQVGGGFLFGFVERVGYRQTDVASSLGVAYGAGYLYNMERNDANFKGVYATPTGSGPLTAGVDRVVVREAVPVATGSGSAALVGTDGTTLSTTRRSGEYAVAVRNGDVVAVGDTGFLAPEDAYEADNEAFVGNLADFLVTGQKEPGAPADPDAERRGERPPAPTRPPTGGTAPTPTPAS